MEKIFGLLVHFSNAWSSLDQNSICVCQKSDRIATTWAIAGSQQQEARWEVEMSVTQASYFNTGCK